MNEAVGWRCTLYTVVMPTTCYCYGISYAYYTLEADVICFSHANVQYSDWILLTRLLLKAGRPWPAGGSGIDKVSSTHQRNCIAFSSSSTVQGSLEGGRGGKDGGTVPVGLQQPGLHLPGYLSQVFGRVTPSTV